LELRQKAADLYRDRQYEISAQQERQLSLLEKQLDANRTIIQSQAKANALEKGRVDPKTGQLQYNQDAAARQEYDAVIKDRDKARTSLSGQALIEAEQKFNNQLIGIFERVSAGERYNIANNPDPAYRYPKEDFEAAYRGQADFARNGLARQQEENALKQSAADDSLARLQATSAIERDAIQRGFNPEQVNALADKQRIALFGSLDRRELSGDDRRDYAASLERQAERESQAEAKALGAYAAIGEMKTSIASLTENFAALTTTGKLKVDVDDFKAKLEIVNDPTLRLLPSAF
jgi:primosomal protein N''